MSSRQAMSNALKIELGRRYRFSASHRLHSPHLSAEENCRVFGKCNNPYGHGHNYVLEVSMSGDVDPATGMIANLADLDAFVERQVLDEGVQIGQIRDRSEEHTSELHSHSDRVWSILLEKK